MNRSLLTGFSKQATCPSSETLLAYKTSKVDAEQEIRITEHLSGCDFCGAELRFLTEHCPQETEECAFVSIPQNLRHLAEALLSRGSLNMERFVEATCEKEGLTLTDA